MLWDDPSCNELSLIGVPKAFVPLLEISLRSILYIYICIYIYMCILLEKNIREPGCLTVSPLHSSLLVWPCEFGFVCVCVFVCVVVFVFVVWFLFLAKLDLNGNLTATIVTMSAAWVQKRSAAIIALHDKRNCAACKTKCSLGYCGQTMAGETCR